MGSILINPLVIAPGSRRLNESGNDSAALKIFGKYLQDNRRLAINFGKIIDAAYPNWDFGTVEDVDMCHTLSEDLSDLADENDAYYSSFYNVYEFIHNQVYGGSAKIYAILNEMIQEYIKEVYFNKDTEKADITIKQDIIRQISEIVQQQGARTSDAGQVVWELNCSDLNFDEDIPDYGKMHLVSIRTNRDSKVSSEWVNQEEETCELPLVRLELSSLREIMEALQYIDKV